MITKQQELNRILSIAIKEAQLRKHESICAEHLLYAILQDAKGSVLLEKCGGDVQALRENILSYFYSEVKMAEEEKEYSLQQSADFQRVLQRAIHHSYNLYKRETLVQDLIVSIFLDEETKASGFLKQVGFSYSEMLKIVTDTDFSLPSDDEEIEEEDKGEQEDKKNALEIYTIDLIKKAKENKISQLVGRDEEIKRITRILSKKNKNNPVLIGESGVGKTAIVEGIAKKIYESEIDALDSYRIFSLDLASLLAGSKFRGELEKRVKSILDALKEIENAILFIDEIQSIISLNNSNSNSTDIASILKPYLLDNHIRCIGTIAYSDYRKVFLKDRAISRRFEPVEIKENSCDETCEIIKQIKVSYEKHHNVKYSEKTIEAAVALSNRYIPERFLPDKAIDVIDEAGAFYVNSKKNLNPKRITNKDIEKIVSQMAKIPPLRLSYSEKNALFKLDKRLQKVIFGQDDAIVALVKAVKKFGLALTSEYKNIGTFLFAGPSGVGKTELAKELAKNLYVDFLRFDMSEYSEKHSVSKFIGSPPGYVGYDEGGALVNQIKKHPYSVVLFDEMEKAHPDLLNVFLQIMDYGTLTDNQGNSADFKNAIIIMTSNLGSKKMEKGQIGFGEELSLQGENFQAIKKFLSPEFRNRLSDIINFEPLNYDIMLKIVDKFIFNLKEQLKRKNITISLDIKTKQYLAKKGFDRMLGARPLERLIEKEIKEPLLDEILFGSLKKGGAVKYSLKDEKIKILFN